MERKESDEVRERRLLRIKDLTKQFCNEVIIGHLNLDISAGHHLLVQGPSGCGKTTLLRCIALLEQIQQGSIEFLGKTVLVADQAPKPDRQTRLQIGIVFQHLYLWPHMTVLENVALPLRAQGVPWNVAREKAEAIIERFCIHHKQGDYPRFLSGGQQQRVALARAFVHLPRLFLLDEITAHLDTRNIDIVFESLAAICSEGVTLVMVTHRGIVPKGIAFATLLWESGRWSLRDA